MTKFQLLLDEKIIFQDKHSCLIKRFIFVRPGEAVLTSKRFVFCAPGAAMRYLVLGPAISDLVKSKNILFEFDTKDIQSIAISRHGFKKKLVITLKNKDTYALLFSSFDRWESLLKKYSKK
jgi:hypothetical protein